MNPSLDDLVLPSGANLQDSELAQALHGRVGLLEAQEKVKLTGDLLSGSAKKKLVAAGLARHAMQRKGWINADELSASTEWFAVQVQQKPKSVGEELSRLKRTGLIDRDHTGWFVPLWALRQAIDFLDE